eukprot:m.322836 g.322836  ORF g.322836 m.322836 type:complete len:349 (+) comp27709_c0_seq1:43-1089(+)
MSLKEFATWLVFLAIGLFWSCFVVPVQVLRLLRNGFGSLRPKKRVEEPAALSDPSLGTHGYVEVAAGVSLHYVTKGQGPLMLFLHGFPEFWYSWRHQMKEFEKDYQVVAIDMRGFASSSKPRGSGNYTVDALTDDVIAVMKHFLKEGKKCTLVSHDWGGAVAWNTAHFAPQYIERLVVMNCPHPALFSKNATFGQFLKSWYIFFFQVPYLPEFTVYVDDYAMIPAALRSRKMGLVRRDNISPDEIELFKYAISRPGAATATINYYRNVWRKPRRWAVKVLPFPVLIIWGEKDGALDFSLMNGVQEYCSDVQVKKIPDASHWVNQDTPELVNQEMRSFCARAVPRTSNI